MDPPPPPLPIHDHHPPPPIPAPRINSCTLTGLPIITISEKYQVHYEFDRKLKKMTLHNCRCQYVPTELDLSILTSWWSEEHKTPIFMCYNYFSNRQEFYIFDKRTGGFEQVAEPRRCYPTRTGGNKVAATIYTNEENQQEHVVIEAGHGESPKKLFWNNGQYLKLEPMTLNTFLMREIQELENVESDEDDAEEGDEEDRKFKDYFNFMQPYIFTVWRENTWLNALDRQTGLYTTFIYHNKQFSRNRAFSNFNSIFEYHLSLAYMEKYDGKCVFHCRNLQFDRMEQYIFDCTSKQFVQVFYEDLPFNPTKVQNFQDVLVSDGDAKFSIIILNGSFTIAEFSEVDSCFSHRPARAVKTFAVQKAEKEKRKKAKRHGDSDGRVVVPEKRRNEQGAQNFGANNSTALPTQSSSGVQNFNISSAKIIIRQNTDAQQPSQLSFSCQCSQPANSQPQPQPTVSIIQQAVQNPPQPVTNNSGPVIVSQPANSSVEQRTGQQPEKTVAHKQACRVQKVQNLPQQPVQQQKTPTSATSINAHVVPTNNTQPEQPAGAQVGRTAVTTNNNSNQNVISSVPTAKPTTAPSNNSQPQKTVSTSHPTVQNPQQPVNSNRNPATVSEQASAPSSAANVSTNNRSSVQAAVLQKQAGNGPHNPPKPQMRPQPVPSTQSTPASTSATTVKAHVETTNNAQPQQPAQAQVLASQVVASNSSNQHVNASVPTSKPAISYSDNLRSQPQQPVQKPPQPGNNYNPITVSQPASIPTSAGNVATGNKLVVQATVQQKQAENGSQKPSQQQMQPQPVTSTQANNASTSVKTVNAHAVSSNSAQTKQPAQVQELASSAVARNNGHQCVISSVPTIKPTTVPSNNLNSEKAVVQKQAREIQQGQNGSHKPSQQQIQSQPTPSTQSDPASTSVKTVSAHAASSTSKECLQPAEPRISTSAGNAINNRNQNVNSSVPTAGPAIIPSNNSNFQPQQTVQNQPKQLPTDPKVAPKPAQPQVYDSAVHAPQQPVNNSNPVTVNQSASAPTSAANVSNDNGIVAQQIAPQPEKTVGQKQGCEILQVQNGPQQPVKQQTQSQPATTTQPKIAPTSVTKASAHDVTVTSSKSQPQLPQVSSPSVSTVKSAATSSDSPQPQKTVSTCQPTVQKQPKQFPTEPTVAQKPAEPQVSTSTELAIKESVSLPVSTESLSSPSQKTGSTNQIVQKPQPVSQQTNNPSSERNVTVQFYNSNMFWMGSNGLVAQKQNAPISDSDLESILSQQQQSVSNCSNLASQPADASSSGANVPTGISSEAEAAEKFQNGPQKPSRKQMQPQRVTSTQPNPVGHVVATAKSQRPGQPKVLASSGVASNNSNQSINSATSPFANLTRGLEEADEDAWESRVYARAPRLDAYGPSGDTSVAQRTRSKQVKGGQQKAPQQPN